MTATAESRLLPLVRDFEFTVFKSLLRELFWLDGRSMSVLGHVTVCIIGADVDRWPHHFNTSSSNYCMENLCPAKPLRYDITWHEPVNIRCGHIRLRVDQRTSSERVFLAHNFTAGF